MLFYIKSIRTKRDATEFFPFSGFRESRDWDEIYRHWCIFIRKMKEQGIIDEGGEFINGKKKKKS